MSSELALSVQGISKTYRITVAAERPTLLAEAVRQRLRRPLARSARESFQALSDVTFDVEKGEAVGIIGSNGAGKSTLLKILSRIVEPTAGRAELYGRLGSLLEVGTGFHPELTGRENIYLNGAVLGMKRREIVRQFDSIVDFAGVERFLDTPVKRYSSGMYVRLAFAVAAHLASDVLVVDEVLAVGDLEFQRKCLGRMGEITRSGQRTVLFVSHNLAAVESFCTRGIHLAEGRIQADGPVAHAVESYLAAGAAPAEEGVGVFDLGAVSRRGPTAESVLRRLEIQTMDGHHTDRIRMGEGLTLVVDVAGLAYPNRGILVRIVSSNNIPLIAMSTVMKAPVATVPHDQQQQFVMRIPSLPLTPGRYSVELLVAEGGAGRRKVVPDQIERAGWFDVLSADVYGSGFTMAGGGPRGGLVYVDMEWELRSNPAAVPVTPAAVPVSPRRS